jgi:proline iminopeptidase
MNELFSAIEPYEAGHLEVGGGYVLYWETVGSPSGKPAVFLHGGPGSGASQAARRYFDQGLYRAVLFDQRGCGRSRPFAGAGDDLSANTTGHLVADIERLREHLGISRWVVVGVSWGVTLALVYAQRHPERVVGMVLGAVTAGTRRETTWITRDMGHVFPKQWDELISAVPPSERAGDLAAAYARLLASPDPEVRADAARRWCAWEDTHVSLMPGWAHGSRYDDPVFPPGLRHARHPLLEPRVLLCGRRGARRHAPGRIYPGSARSRTLRRFQPARHGLATAPGVAGQPPGRDRRRWARRRQFRH